MVMRGRKGPRREALRGRGLISPGQDQVPLGHRSCIHPYAPRLQKSLVTDLAEEHVYITYCDILGMYIYYIHI